MRDEFTGARKQVQLTLIILIVALYLVAINLATWGAFRHDQNLAVRGSRRLPEIGLLTLAALGGTPAVKRAQRFGHLQKLGSPTRKCIKRISYWHRRLVMLGICAATIVLAQIYLTTGS